MINKETIYILGFGAIGKALSVFLASSGKSVTAIRSSIDDGTMIDENVVIELPDGTTMEQKIRITTLKSLNKIDGLLVLTAKSFANQTLSQALKAKLDNSPVVILQNGLNVETPFLDNHFNHIYRCVLFTTCQILENGVVRFRPVTDSPVGMIKGDTATLNKIVAQINTTHFRFKPEADIQKIIWKKALINTVFNGVCPLLNTDNGIFYREPLAFQMAQKLISSGILIAQQVGVDLEAQDIETSLLNISKAADGQLISTLQDINNGRHTEIDTLNVEISAMAQKAGVAMEAREIALLGELIKIKEKLNLRSH